MSSRIFSTFAVAVLVATACSGGDDPGTGGESPDFVRDVRTAVAAVDDELGAPQRYFEVTANAQLTNVFVAVDDETAVVPYLVIDGELQPPAPKQTGASGETFTADDIDFDETLIASRVADELPDASINALSVYGDGFGATYVLAARSSVGGLLDIVVGPEGQIASVDPVSS